MRIVLYFIGEEIETKANYEARDRRVNLARQRLDSLRTICKSPFAISSGAFDFSDGGTDFLQSRGILVKPFDQELQDPHDDMQPFGGLDIRAPELLPGRQVVESTQDFLGFAIHSLPFVC